MLSTEATEVSPGGSSAGCMNKAASDQSSDLEAIGEAESCVAGTSPSWTGGEADMEANPTEGKGETCSSLEANTTEGKGKTCSSMAQAGDAATLSRD